MTRMIINRGNDDFSLSPVREDAEAVVFRITEFRADAPVDVSSAPECVRRYVESAVVPPMVTETRFLVNAASTGPLVVPIAQLDDLIAWLDAQFPGWDTARGLYSRHAFLATDYTAAEIDQQIAREEFWDRAERYGDLDEPAGAWV